MIRKAMTGILELLSGEWMLHFAPNGGGVVFLRSLQVSALFFLLSIGLDSFLLLDRLFVLSWRELAASTQDKLTWFGALFGATYAVFYTRFASQWLYLGGLYNQLMFAENEAPRHTLSPDKRAKRLFWWMAFIEDAIDVHLAGKRAHAETIAVLLSEPEVRLEFLASNRTIPHRGDWLRKRLVRALTEERFTRLSTPTTPPSVASGHAVTTLDWLSVLREKPSWAAAYAFAHWLETEQGATECRVAIARLTL